FATIFFACENQKESLIVLNGRDVDYTQVSSELTSQFSDVFSNSKNIKPITVIKEDERTGYGKLERRKLLIESSEYLFNEYYSDIEINNIDVLYDEILTLSDRTNNARITEDLSMSIINNTTVSSGEQKKLLNSCVNHVSNLSDINGIQNLVLTYNNAVISSKTQNEEQ